MPPFSLKGGKGLKKSQGTTFIGSQKRDRVISNSYEEIKKERNQFFFFKRGLEGGEGNKEKNKDTRFRLSTLN